MIIYKIFSKASGQHSIFFFKNKNVSSKRGTGYSKKENNCNFETDAQNLLKLLAGRGVKYQKLEKLYEMKDFFKEIEETKLNDYEELRS